MNLKCPAYGTTFTHQFNIKQGLHAEHACECGKFLQWDYAGSGVGGSGAIRRGSGKVTLS